MCHVYKRPWVFECVCIVVSYSKHSRQASGLYYGYLGMSETMYHDSTWKIRPNWSKQVFGTTSY